MVAASELPDDWQARRIDSFASITTGSRNTQDRVKDGRFPFFVRSQNVERINTWSFDGEAVLTAGDGVGTGKVFHYIDGKFDCHQRVYRIADFAEEVDGFYFFKAFESQFYGRIMSMTAKSSVDSVRREMIAGMDVAIPPLPEQQTIAKTLGDMDDLIASLDTLIAKKEAIKRGMMQQLFQDLELESVETASVGADCILHARIGWQGLKTDEYRKSGDYRLITGTEFVDGRIDNQNCAYVDEWRYKQDQKIQLKAGDVLVTKDGTIGKSAYIEELPVPATLNSGIFVVRPRSEKLCAEFLFWILQSQIFSKFIDELQAGSTIVHLYQKDFVHFRFPAPHRAVQEGIAEALNSATADVVGQVRKRQKYLAIRQAMAEQLLAGRIRLV